MIDLILYFSIKKLFILAELSELFASFGSVLEASVIKDYGFIVRKEIHLSNLNVFVNY
jgi:hypothetical protein